MTPENLGRYEILGELGKGAMGVVYLAQDPIIRRQLAIKTFRMAYSAKEKEVEQFRERFLREAQAIGQLSHPNIVTVHDVGQEEDEYFIAMEYVKGINLKQKMQRDDGPLPLDFVVEVAAQVAEGLACAHEAGIVHRDVKPANIIITGSGRVKITDFGIARIEQSNLTVAGQLLGTPNYMAPEQIQGKAVDSRTDIFSLGVLVYEMLTRKKPFAGENLTQVTHRIVYDDFTSPVELVGDLPADLLRILHRAMDKDPDKRYQQATEMARDLRATLAGEAPLADEVPAADEAKADEAKADEAKADETPVPAAEAAPPPPATSPDASEPPPPPPSAEEPPPAPPEELAAPAERPAAATSEPLPPAPPPEPTPASTSGAVSAAVAPLEESSAPPEPPEVQRPPPPPPPAAAGEPAAPDAVASTAPAQPPASPMVTPRVGIAVAALAVVAVAAAGLMLNRGIGGGAKPEDDPPPSGPASPALALVERAEEMARSGRVQAAVLELEKGLFAHPTSREVATAYLRLAERVDERDDLVEDYVAERMMAADALIIAKQYERAYDVLERVLLVAPEHPAATTKVEDIERFLSRRRQEQIRAERRAHARPPPVGTPPPPPVAAPPPPEPGEVAISFRTLIAAGTVTVLANGETLWQQSFDFDNRRLFKRKYLKGQRGFDETQTLEAGFVELKVKAEVDAKEGLTALESDLMRGTVPPGTTPTLQILITEDGLLKTTWIPP